MGSRSWLFIATALVGFAVACKSDKQANQDERCRAAAVVQFEECGFDTNGHSVSKVVGAMTKECQEALGVDGEIRYAPHMTPAGENWNLENSAEAEAWIDCIATWGPGGEEPGPGDSGFIRNGSCEDIDPRAGGVCAPSLPRSLR